MKYKEILAQIETLQKKAESARRTELAKAIAEIKARMKETGVTPADLREAPGDKRAAKTAARKTAKTIAQRKVAAKYREPSSGAEWSGRGRQPRWLAAAIAKGTKLESFLIKR